MNGKQIIAAIIDTLTGALTGRSVRVHVEPLPGVHVNLYPVRGVRRAAKKARKRRKATSDDT